MYKDFIKTPEFRADLHKASDRENAGSQTLSR